MRKRRSKLAPRPTTGAARVSRFVSADEPDAFAAVCEWYRSRGWSPIERDYAVTPNGRFNRVELWAVPPERSVNET